MLCMRRWGWFGITEFQSPIQRVYCFMNEILYDLDSVSNVSIPYSKGLLFHVQCLDWNRSYCRSFNPLFKGSSLAYQKKLMFIQNQSCLNPLFKGSRITTRTDAGQRGHLEVSIPYSKGLVFQVYRVRGLCR